MVRGLGRSWPLSWEAGLVPQPPGLIDGQWRPTEKEGVLRAVIMGVMEASIMGCVEQSPVGTGAGALR